MAELLRAHVPPFQLTSLLQLAEADELTGWLTIGTAGRVGLREGVPVVAERGLLRGREALLSLLMGAEGAVTVDDAAPDADDATPLGASAWLTMQAAQLMDEWQQLAPQILSEVTWPSPTVLQKRLLSVLDGERTLAEAVLLTRLEIIEIIDDIEAGLRDGRLVRARPPNPERARRATAIPIQGSFFELLDQGRHYLRQRRFLEAEAVLMAALQLSPDDRTAQQNLRRVRQLHEEAE